MGVIVQGLLKVGEAQPAIRAIARRQRGASYIFYAFQFGLIIIGGILGFELDQSFRLSGGGIGLGVGIFVGALSYQFVCRKVLLWRFRKELAGRGIAMDLPLSMEVTPDALIYDVGDVHHVAKWSAVTEVFRSAGYWVFLVQSSPWFAPERFFENQKAEHAFIRSSLAFMSEGAKARSPDATSLADI